MIHSATDALLIVLIYLVAGVNLLTMFVCAQALRNARLGLERRRRTGVRLLTWVAAGVFFVLYSLLLTNVFDFMIPVTLARSAILLMSVALLLSNLK